MGRIRIQMELENAGDRIVFRRGRMNGDKIRSHITQGLVDTAAVMLLLPEEVVEELGLETVRTIRVTYADERKEIRPVAGPLTIKIGDRSMMTECIVGPAGSEPLIGQVVLEVLDLLADCARQVLVPRPESPDYPLLSLK